MLQVCGDSIGGVSFDPSGKYVFVQDFTTKEIPILYVSLALKKLEASGASIPAIPMNLAFSPDGLLVYAAENSEILVYVFNPHMGLLTARTSIAAPGVGKILPVK
jgi:DNA-binding beta-propeller fold protein YncE